MVSPAHCPLEEQWGGGGPHGPPNQRTGVLWTSSGGFQRTLQFSDMAPLRSPWTLPTPTLTPIGRLQRVKPKTDSGKIHAPLAVTLLQQPLHSQNKPTGGQRVPVGKGRSPRATTRPASPQRGTTCPEARPRAYDARQCDQYNAPRRRPHNKHPSHKKTTRMLNDMK